MFFRQPACGLGGASGVANLPEGCHGRAVPAAEEQLRTELPQLQRWRRLHAFGGPPSPGASQRRAVVVVLGVPAGGGSFSPSTRLRAAGRPLVHRRQRLARDPRDVQWTDVLRDRGPDGALQGKIEIDDMMCGLHRKSNIEDFMVLYESTFYLQPIKRKT